MTHASRRWPVPLALRAVAEQHLLIAQAELTEGRTITELFIAREYLAGRYRPQT
mgnify:CR=1 FL=1